MPVSSLDVHRGFTGDVFSYGAGVGGCFLFQNGNVFVLGYPCTKTKTDEFPLITAARGCGNIESSSVPTIAKARERVNLRNRGALESVYGGSLRFERGDPSYSRFN